MRSASCPGAAACSAPACCAPRCTSPRARSAPGASAELRAILAHEEHHRARRDPLRLLCAQVVADALRPLPPFASLADRQAALAELAADAASVKALGDVKPLASALARFDASDEPGTGVAPERVDQLTGLLRAATIPSALLVAAGVALAAIVAAVAGMLLAEWHLDVALRSARARSADRGLRAGRRRGPPGRGLPAPCLAADVLLSVVVGPTTGHR